MFETKHEALRWARKHLDDVEPFGMFLDPISGGWIYPTREGSRWGFGEGIDGLWKEQVERQ